MAKNMTLLEGLSELKDNIDKGLEGAAPGIPELIPVYESVVLMKRKYEGRLREIEQAASERDAFYSEMQNIRAEHHMAEKIQRSMLPTEPGRYAKLYGVDLFADMDTAWEVGGDYYDFFPIDENRMFFCIADVAGKGVPAAIFCSVVKTLIGVSLHDSEDMADVFTNVSKNLYLNQSGAGKLFATLWAGILDRRDGTVSYVNAGHDSPYIIRQNGTVESVDTRSGMPVAAYFNPKKPEKSSYTGFTLKLDRGDMLLLYTDGITDSGDHDGIRYGRDNLTKRLQGIPVPDMTSKEVVTLLERSIGTYAEQKERDDDITLLAVKYMGMPCDQAS